MKKKIVYIAPHLSTGGMPQYLVKQIELIKDEFDVYCVEWENITGGVLVIQRNRVQTLLGDKLFTLSENKQELFDILNKVQPDIIHVQEIPELFMQSDVANKLYSSQRNYVIIETSHDSSFDTNNKRYLPDKFFLISQHQINMYQRLGVPHELVEHVIEYKQRTKTREQALRDLGLDPNIKHIINVGLFTPRKNQSEIVEYARLLKDYPIQFHFIGNQADNFKFYWEPLMKNFPSNCKWWNERDDVDAFYEAADLFLFTSTYETMPLVVREAIGWNIPSLIYNLPVYLDYFSKFDNIEYLDFDSVSNNCKKILDRLQFVKMYDKDRMTVMKKKLVYNYNETKPFIESRKPQLIIHNVDGASVDIRNGPDSNYKIRFIDKKTDEVVYQTTIGNNSWAKTSAKYFVDWKIEIQDLTSQTTYEYDLVLENKRVYISVESKSLGDMLAWIPYVEEFRKKHNCILICSTFANHLFADQYPNIQFVEPSEVVNDIFALYRIGIFYDGDDINKQLHPTYPMNKPLQQVAADMLGIEYKEIKPKITQPVVEKDEKLVTFAIHSTTQAKYWNNPTGWQDVVDYLNEKGYTVKLLSYEPDGFMGNKHPVGIVQHPPSSLESIMTEIKKSKVFIGIGSGLSWLSWVLDVPTILISGFSDPISEMKDCIRITAPEGSCHGCFNRVKLIPEDWNWCPDHKGTPRQFECSKNITSDTVIKELQKIL
jgi:autotransporter strand-loop-strand O-heptosyltransferase